MTEVYLLRHGIAVAYGTPDFADDERPLTPKGEKRMQQIGRGLRRLDLRPDRIVTSPLPRALKTAEIVAEALGISNRLETADALRPERDAASIRAWLQTRPEPRLMLVGHNPSLSNLIGVLINGGHPPIVCELRKGGIAALGNPDDRGLRLDWLATPRLLRLLCD